MSTDDVVVDRVRHGLIALAGQLEGDEPRTTRLIAELLSDRPARARKAWTVRDGSGELLGALVTVRLCFDRWVAFPYLADPRAAAAVAELIDASVAWSASGTSTDIDPLVPLMRRSQDVLARPLVHSRAPITDAIPWPSSRSRVATMADFDQLVGLFSGYELAGGMTQQQLLQLVRDWVRRDLMVVSVDGGRIAGAAVLTCWTRQFGLIGALSVLPEHRQRGIAWDLVQRMCAIARAMGIGLMTAVAPSNPMLPQIPGIEWSSTPHMVVQLAEPVRFRGQGRLRRLYGRFRPLNVRTATLYRDPADPLRPPPD